MGSEIIGIFFMETFQYPDWQKLCQEALVELDKDKLRERVAAAEAAILSRLSPLSPGTVSPEEREALANALASLRVLKRETLGSLIYRDKSE